MNFVPMGNCCTGKGEILGSSGPLPGHWAVIKMTRIFGDSVFRAVFFQKKRHLPPSKNCNIMDAVTTVKNYYDCFNRKDYEGMLALLDDQIRHEPNQGEARIGKDLFVQFLQHMDATYDESLSDMVFYTEPNGERVACEFTVNGIYKKTDEGLPPAKGQSYRLPAASFLSVNNGKITRVATFYNLPLWIKLVS
jgi:steroid delta-isomerase-like uncharacterized protein